MCVHVSRKFLALRLPNRIRTGVSFPDPLNERRGDLFANSITQNAVFRARVQKAGAKHREQGSAPLICCMVNKVELLNGRERRGQNAWLLLCRHDRQIIIKLLHWGARGRRARRARWRGASFWQTRL